MVKTDNGIGTVWLVGANVQRIPGVGLVNFEGLLVNRVEGIRYLLVGDTRGDYTGNLFRGGMLRIEPRELEELIVGKVADPKTGLSRLISGVDIYYNPALPPVSGLNERRLNCFLVAFPNYPVAVDRVGERVVTEELVNKIGMEATFPKEEYWVDIVPEHLTRRMGIDDDPAAVYNFLRMRFTNVKNPWLG